MNSDETTHSTGRLQLATAPGGLSVVQDLLNSASMPVASVPDLLADEAPARAWLEASLHTWGEQTSRTTPDIAISGDDLAALRDLRSRVRRWITNQADAEAETWHPLEVDVSFREGHLAHKPGENGAAAVASLVYLEALLASHTGRLSRLKTCMNPDCGAAFYDLSRNGTRVWHDMKTCGNTMNLRASRARRRKHAEPRPTPTTATGT